MFHLVQIARRYTCWWADHLNQVDEHRIWPNFRHNVGDATVPNKLPRVNKMTPNKQQSHWRYPLHCVVLYFNVNAKMLHLDYVRVLRRGMLKRSVGEGDNLALVQGNLEKSEYALRRQGQVIISLSFLQSEKQLASPHQIDSKQGCMWICVHLYLCLCDWLPLQLTQYSDLETKHIRVKQQCTFEM